MSKPTVVICDLDGTLAIHDGRNPYDEQKCDTDLVNEPVAVVLDAMMAQGYTVIFTSGRTDACREKSEKWISNTASIFKPILFMRKTGDRRSDDVVKEEIYRRDIEPFYNVLFCLDDRGRVVRKWRELGLVCFQVNEGPPEKRVVTHGGKESAVVAPMAEPS